MKLDSTNIIHPLSYILVSSCSLICKRWHKKLYEAIYFSTTLGVVLSNQRVIDSTGAETRQIFSRLFVKAKKCDCLIRVFYASHSRCWIEQLIVTYTNKIRNAETRKKWLIDMAIQLQAYSVHA